VAGIRNQQPGITEEAALAELRPPHRRCRSVGAPVCTLNMRRRDIDPEGATLYATASQWTGPFALSKVAMPPN
jgi:hypothetical protein